MEWGRFRAMGSEISWWGDHDISNEVSELFEEVESCCSRFRIDSELSTINRHPYDTITLSPLMTEMLEVADRAYLLSEGLVDPTVLPAVRAAGYDGDLATASKEPTGPVLVPGWDRVSLHGATLTRPPGIELDLGGVAKGWAAQAALAVEGARAIDAAGDISVSGSWMIEVKHAGTCVARLSVEDCGVATSGIDRRRWAGGHHLIDPTTGAPAETDVVAATVVAADLSVAETVARTIVLMGAWEGLGWAEEIPEVRGALVTTKEEATLSFPRTQEVLV